MSAGCDPLIKSLRYVVFVCACGVVEVGANVLLTVPLFAIITTTKTTKNKIK